MVNQYTGVFEHVDGWWIGHVEELPGEAEDHRVVREAVAVTAVLGEDSQEVSMKS